MPKTISIIAQSYLRGCALGFIAPVIVIPLGIVLIFMPIWAFTHFTLSIWALIIPVALFVFILLAGGFGFLIWALRRRANRLDAAFVPLGLEGHRVMISMRNYSGWFRGREAYVHFRRGPTLEIYINTPLQTRMSVDESDRITTSIASWVNRYPLELSDPSLSNLRVFALDEEWTRSLLSDPMALTLLRRLLESDSPFLVRQIELMPGSFVFRQHYSNNWFDIDVKSDQARSWFDDLLALAGIAESLPAPLKTEKAQSVEQMFNNQSKFSRWVLIILLSVFLIIPLCVALPITLFLILFKP